MKTVDLMRGLPIWFAAFAMMALSACSPTSESLLPPAELKPFTASHNVDRVWKVNTGAGNQGKYIPLEPIVIADKVITVDGKGDVTAFLMKGGSKVWSKDLDAVITAGADGGGFGRQAIVVSGDEDGKLYAISAIDGEFRWETQLSSQVTAISNIDSGMLVARTIDGRVHGVEAATGLNKWSFFRESPALSLHGQSKPLLAHGGVAIGTDNGSVVMLTLNEGSPIWEIPLATGRGRSEIERMVDIDGALAFQGEELFAVTFQGRVASIDARRGKLKWSKKASSTSGVDVDQRGLFYTSENGVISALSKASGTEVWTQDGLLNRKVTRPVVLGNTIVVADYDGYVHWLDRNTGAFVQRKQVASGGILLAPVIYGDQILVLSNSGSLSMWK